jgi:hypothetical protein
MGELRRFYGNAMPYAILYEGQASGDFGVHRVEGVLKPPIPHRIVLRHQ